MRHWTGGENERSFDLIVVGSGAAGLLAAVVAAKSGQRVAVLERAAWFGGTSAISGGTLWVANNPYMIERGLEDSREAGLAYLRAVTKGHTPDEVLQAVVDRGPDMIRWLREHADLHFASVDDYPDYRPDLPGSVGGGRSLDPALYDARRLGALWEALRPDRRPPFTMQEYEQWVAFTRFPWPMLEERAEQGLVSRGNAVVAPLLTTASDLGVTLVSEARVTRLATHGGRVIGVDVDGERLDAAAVVLACGGFEWDDDMSAQFLAGPIQGRCSPPHNTGDGIRMGQRLGARIGNMREAFWAPMTLIPGDELEGRQLGTLLRFERQGPGSIIVDKRGRRCVNESQNYNDMTRALHAVDPISHGYEHLPAHIVVDQEYVEQYGLLSFRAGGSVPPWMHVGDTLSELAESIGVPSEALRDTVERFNAHAVEGVDPDFTRGANDYDQYWGDGDRGYPNRSLAPLTRAPFYAIEIVPGAFGTCGGLVTDASARVLDVDGEPIAGLFAAGNTTAHPSGGGYPGAGGTLGPGMTMAYIAGSMIAAASEETDR